MRVLSVMAFLLFSPVLFAESNIDSNQENLSECSSVDCGFNGATLGDNKFVGLNKNFNKLGVTPGNNPVSAPSFDFGR